MKHAYAKLMDKIALSQNKPVSKVIEERHGGHSIAWKKNYDYGKQYKPKGFVDGFLKPFGAVAGTVLGGIGIKSIIDRSKSKVVNQVPDVVREGLEDDKFKSLAEDISSKSRDVMAEINEAVLNLPDKLDEIVDPIGAEPIPDDEGLIEMLLKFIPRMFGIID